MPLSKHLIELHGGTLSIESEIGVGTKVILLFPEERVMREPQYADKAFSVN